MQKHYFELDKVDSITLTMEKESTEYAWKERVPERPKKFLGIKIGTRLAVPAGWTAYEDETESVYCRRRDKSYFDQYSWYRVDEVTKRIFVKPYVVVRFGYKQEIRTRFENDAEAQAWVDDLITSSDKKFHVIINK